jgi:glycosyltransferase involved in cell wall biosynthesis
MKIMNETAKSPRKLLVLVCGTVVGGHEMQLKEILWDLCECYADVTVVCATVVSYEYFYGIPGNVILLPFSEPGKIWVQWIRARAIAKKLAPLVNRVDGIIVSGGTIEACIGAARACKLVSPTKALVAYIPMYIDRSITNGVVGALYNLIVKAMAPVVDRYLTINRIQARLIAEAFSRPAAIVENKIRPVCRPSGSKGPRLVYVGRFDDKQKKVVELINFLDTTEQPYRELVIIGDGPDGNAVADAAASAAAIKVSLLGWLSAFEVDRALGTEDCLIMNSRWEGEPLVIREFAARGLPCVARDITGVRGVTSRSMRYRTREELIEVLCKTKAGAAPVKQRRADSSARHRVLRSLFPGGAHEGCR